MGSCLQLYKTKILEICFLNIMPAVSNTVLCIEKLVKGMSHVKCDCHTYTQNKQKHEVTRNLLEVTDMPITLILVVLSWVYA